MFGCNRNSNSLKKPSRFNLEKAIRRLLSSLTPSTELPRPKQRLTTLEHEPDFKFNVPHHFKVRAAQTGEVIAEVHFQEGPVKENGLNGLQNEDLLEMVIARLRGFQNSPFACAENSDALNKIEEALAILNARTAKREARGVEGTNKR